MKIVKDVKNKIKADNMSTAVDRLFGGNTSKNAFDQDRMIRSFETVGSAIDRTSSEKYKIN